MPPLKVVVFFDGQNLYHGAKDAWAPVPFQPNSLYSWPSYDVEKMSTWLVNRKPNRVAHQVRFYTGVPDPVRGNVQEFWHGFWSNKLRYLSSKGVYVYRGRVNAGGQEKGVDVSIAIDLIRLTYERAYDVALIVSQDADFIPAVKLAKELVSVQGRQIGIESAYPLNPTNRRGIVGTEWVHIRKTDYDACVDPREYRIRPYP